MNRHIVWTIPLVDLALFGGCGLLLAVAARIWPHRAVRSSAGLLGGLAILTLLLTYQGLHHWASLSLACGLSFRLGYRGEIERPAFRRLVRWSTPVLAIVVMGLVGCSLGRHALAEWRSRLLASAAPARVRRPTSCSSSSIRSGPTA